MFIRSLFHLDALMEVFQSEDIFVNDTKNAC